MKKEIVIFTGPSLRPCEAMKTFDKATYKPPIKRNDAINAYQNGAKIIGIIDGVFFSNVAVSPRELIHLLEKGVILIGGASMGALRAAELDEYGMIGVGKIYQMYKRGKLVSDDEVAVIFDPVTLEPLSEPLVNIRLTLERLSSKGLISSDLKDALLEIAQKLYYPLRTYETIIAKAISENIISEKEERCLLDILNKNKIDLKRMDALQVIEKVKEVAIKFNVL